MNRRTFLGMLGVGVGFGLPGRVPGLALPARGSAAIHAVGRQQVQRHALPRIATVSGEGLTLTARPSMADIGPARSSVWTLNDSFPAPTIRLRRGRTARIDLQNDLPEQTILHWHGLNVPQEADGHPRLAVDPASKYAYEFTVGDRAGTYWYHPHTHELTAPQTYMGMAGLLIVEDEEETARGLPSGEYEIPLILQDKRLAGSSSLAYEPAMGPDMMLGFLGDTAFGNGVADPTLGVKRGRYRLRILNASNARIFDLGLSNGDGFTLIGTDGGLLEVPVRLQRLMLATGERADLLVDFSGRQPGERTMLRSFGFEVPGMMMGMGMAMGRGRGRGPTQGRGGGMMMGGTMQGTEMDFVEFVVLDSPSESNPPLPARLSEIPRPELSASTPRRTFRFNSMMMNHTINGRTFDIERVDERVPIGQTEVWSLVNDSELPHPVHIHAGQFRVLSRDGGRNRVMPWETGLKDTVLVFPRERVDVAVRFDDYPGLFLLHCHNLEHEDMGMMLNFEVVQ
jgi:FtsP/CotA-like multicopper oxidase with cupredoxin domain